jgi:hypothetical protein
VSAPFEDFGNTVPRELIDATGLRKTAAAAVPFWGDSPESWETVVIAGYRLPGVCTLDGKVRRRHDKKNTAGTNGSTVTYVGDDQAEFSVTVTMWTSEHLDTYGNIIDFLRSMTSAELTTRSLTSSEHQASSKKNTTSRPFSKFPVVPLDLVHPVLSLHRIKSAHVIEYGFPKAKGDASSGIYEAVIRFLEYVPGQKGAVSTPKSAADNLNLDINKRYGDGALPKAAKAAKPSVANGGTP